MAHITHDLEEDAAILREWSRDVFLFASEALDMQPSEPIDELKGVSIPYKDAFDNEYQVQLFNEHGQLTYHDLSFYTVDMFKNQDRASFRQYKGKRFTWQQTVKLTAYNRAINTFNRDAYDMALRWITTRSGHGTGKTASTSIIALHFLLCFPGAQVGMTANSEQQVQDIFMKELSKWRMKLPDALKNSINVTSDHVRIEDSEDWFLRAQVARPERPEALAGLHGDFVLILVDEASGVSDKVFEVMKGALTGDNYLVMYDSNPTRNEGEFFESHKAGSTYNKLHFSSRDSPIVKEGYIQKMEDDYGVDSDEVKIRVDGDFAGMTEMDDKGWMPLFGNMTILFEPERGQIIHRPILGFDPAGSGTNRAVGVARDNIYLKEVMNEEVSNEKDGARKVEAIRDAYGTSSNDVGIDAFGVGAKWVAEIQVKVGESVMAILTDKPREETKDKFHTYKAELAWMFREWVRSGGIIITNNPKGWLRELDKIKFKRDLQGRIMLMDKVTFKKEYGFSPDRFDAAIHTFFRGEPTQKPVMTKNEMEAWEAKKFMEQANPQKNTSLSSMG